MIHFKVELKLSGYQLPAVITPAWQGQNRHNHAAYPFLPSPQGGMRSGALCTPALSIAGSSVCAPAVVHSV